MKLQKKVGKCQFGYLNYQTKFEILKTILLFVASLGVLVLGMGISGSKYNLLTIVAVLGLLPSAKSLIGCIMFLRAKKYACPEELHNKIEAIIKDKDPQEFLPYCISYDNYMTSYDKNFPIKTMACIDHNLIGYTDYAKFDHAKAEEHITALLGQNGLKVSVIKIFTNEEKYLERLKALVNNEEIKADEQDVKVIHLMGNLSL